MSEFFWKWLPVVWMVASALVAAISWRLGHTGEIVPDLSSAVAWLCVFLADRDAENWRRKAMQHADEIADLYYKNTKVE